jgi:hypothetical protein
LSDSDQLSASVALLGAALAIIIRLRFRDQLTRDTSRLTYQLNHPNGLTIEQVANFLRALSRLRPERGWLFGRDSIAFELVGLPDQIQYRLRLPEHQADALLRQLRAVAPGIRPELLQHSSLPEPKWMRRIHLTTANRPLRTEDAEAFAASLLSSLQPIGPEEVVLYQLVVYPVRKPQEAADSNLTIREFRAEGDAKRIYRDSYGSQHMLRPDALIRLTSGDMQLSWFVEIDRATESPRRIADKCRRYRAYELADLEYRRYGVFPGVVFIVPDEHRARVIQQVIASQPPEARGLFWVAIKTDAIRTLTHPNVT